MCRSFFAPLACGVARRVGDARTVDVERHGVAVVDGSVLDRFEARGTFTQALQRLLDSCLFHLTRRTAQRHGSVVAWLERGNRIEGRGEREGLALLDRDVANVRGVNRFHAPFPQRVVDGPRDEAVRDIVQDLILEALLDDARRRLAGTEAGNPRLARIVARNAIDFRVHDVAGNFDPYVLACLVDVDQVGFHGQEFTVDSLPFTGST